MAKPLPVLSIKLISLFSLFQARRVELKTRQDTPDVSNLQKCADFVHAFVLGFDCLASVLMTYMWTPLRYRT
jgi:RNA-binding protein PNO1